MREELSPTWEEKMTYHSIVMGGMPEKGQEGGYNLLTSLSLLNIFKSCTLRVLYHVHTRTQRPIAVPLHGDRHKHHDQQHKASAESTSPPRRLHLAPEQVIAELSCTIPPSTAQEKEVTAPAIIFARISLWSSLVPLFNHGSESTRAYHIHINGTLSAATSSSLLNKCL